MRMFLGFLKISQGFSVRNFVEVSIFYWLYSIYFKNDSKLDQKLHSEIDFFL